MSGKAFLDVLIKELDLQPSGQVSFRCNGKLVRENQLHKEIGPELLEKGLSEQEFTKYSVSMVKDRDFHEKFIGARIPLLRKRITEIKIAPITSQETVFDLSKNFRYRNLNLVIDVRTGQEILFDSASSMSTDLDVDTWRDHLPDDKELRSAVLSKTIRGHIEYNPYSSTSTKIVSYMDQDIYQINSHIMPEWRLNEVDNPQLPEFFEGLMDHLFPQEECKEYVFHWLHTMLVSRAQTYLVLNSVPGTGKGTLCEVVEKLVGVTNYQKQGEGFFNSPFNKELERKRAFVFDEVPVSKKNKDMMKLIINNTITIESKGRDVKGEIQNFASFIITNNHDYNVYLVRNDRRFSVPEITHVPLEKRFTIKEIEKFHVALNTDPNVIANIGWYILKHGRAPGMEDFTVWKGKKFFHLVHESLHEWQKFLVGRIEERKEDKIKLTDLRWDYEDATGLKKFVGPKTLDSFLLEHRDAEGDYLASLKRSNGEYFVYPTPKYCPEEKFDL